MNLGALLSRHARYRPDRLALVFEDLRLTFRDLDENVNRLATALLIGGVAKGDKVATILSNCSTLLMLYGTLLASAWRMSLESIVLHTGSIVFKGALVTFMPVLYVGATILYPQFDAEAMIRTVEREIAEAAVFGVPDNKRGKRPIAAVAPRAEESLDKEKLRERINTHVQAKFQKLSFSMIFLGTWQARYSSE